MGICIANGAHILDPNSLPPVKLRQGCPEDLLHSRSQRAVQLACRTQPATVISAFEGVQDALDECAAHMKFQPWDCSNVDNIFHDPQLLHTATRESALIWALSSAGAAWGIATSCAQGWLSDCACSENTPGGGSYEYGGCTNAVHYGVRSARRLLTKSQSNQPNLFRKIEKQNLKAGRLALKKTLISSCKCHGVSGSCQQKTCWKRAAALNTITDFLIEKHARAKMYRPNVTMKSNDLFYLDASPDHCQIDTEKPRVCAWRNETHMQGDCSKLCCGRGYSVRHEVVHAKCECQFVWCCDLVCKDCLQHRWVSTCNTKSESERIAKENFR
ncbi:hypothetical protein WR25_04205 [Diploscapter pachys]|uniref:Protein Wnt n=1 Tax=Diploscapter pachys TaxID=2018661 RepID=A0A2A2K0Y1_9BILA|nr:hypothetical protein WR25_04205 [Diploscapter pachys]